MNTNMTTPHPVNQFSELEKYLHKLSSEHGHDRQAAIEWLSKHPEESRPPLMQILKSEASDWTKEAVFKTLGKMAIPSDLEILDSLEAAGKHDFWLTQAIAANASPKAFELLAQYASEPDIRVAGDALVALGSSADERSRGLLETYLSNNSAALRWKAAHALSVMGGKQSKSAIQSQLKVEKDQEVREKLQEALK